MKLLDLFQNSLRLTRELDCRRFADEPAYREALESELCGDLKPSRPARKNSAATGDTDDETWALSH